MKYIYTTFIYLNYGKTAEINIISRFGGSRMDKSSVIGLIIALIALLVGMVMKGVSLSAFYNPAAILIIIFGTISAVTIAFPMKELKRVPKLFKILFKETKLADDIEIIKMFSQWADLARREGLLALESKASEIEDPFLKMVLH